MTNSYDNSRDDLLSQALQESELDSLLVPAPSSEEPNPASNQIPDSTIPIVPQQQTVPSIAPNGSSSPGPSTLGSVSQQQQSNSPGQSVVQKKNVRYVYVVNSNGKVAARGSSSPKILQGAVSTSPRTPGRSRGATIGPPSSSFVHHRVIPARAEPMTISPTTTQFQESPGQPRPKISYTSFNPAHYQGRRDAIRIPSRGRPRGGRGSSPLSRPVVRPIETTAFSQQSAASPGPGTPSSTIESAPSPKPNRPRLSTPLILPNAPLAAASPCLSTPASVASQQPSQFPAPVTVASPMIANTQTQGSMPILVSSSPCTTQAIVTTTVPFAEHMYHMYAKSQDSPPATCVASPRQPSTSTVQSGSYAQSLPTVIVTVCPSTATSNPPASMSQSQQSLSEHKYGMTQPRLGISGVQFTQKPRAYKVFAPSTPSTSTPTVRSGSGPRLATAFGRGRKKSSHSSGPPSKKARLIQNTDGSFTSVPTQPSLSSPQRLPHPNSPIIMNSPVGSNVFQSSLQSDGSPKPNVPPFRKPGAYFSPQRMAAGSGTAEIKFPDAPRGRGRPPLEKNLGAPQMSPGMSGPQPFIVGQASDPSKPMGPIDEDEEENLTLAETYFDYRPSKLRSGLPHPDFVVETSSLASVQPPDVKYHISIPEEIVDTGCLSALQLEAVIYACQMHENRLPSGERCGYLVGDGAGVGKGRTIAGIIQENYALGRKKSLWFSVSTDLKYDSERDLMDTGGGKIRVHALNKFKYSKISGKENGSVKKGVIFATYASLIGESHSARNKYSSRLKQLLHWCGQDFDGVIVFDECHRAKNLMPTGSGKPTKTGQSVLELQKALPNARVVYASATGATEPRNMAYMTRLGLWGEGRPFREFTDFINAVERRGVGAMELVAMDMKQRGAYIARQLSFNGVSFRIEEVPLSKEFIKVYDQSVRLWLEARKQFELAADLVSAEKGVRKSMWGQFWASHQRFFKYLCIASKVRSVVRLTREAIKNGKCVVIGLQSTGEARTLDALEETGGELTDFVSTAKAVFECLVNKHFPCDNSSMGYSSTLFDMDSMFDFTHDSTKDKMDSKREGSDDEDRAGGGEEKSESENEGSSSSASDSDAEGGSGSSLDSESSADEEKEKTDDWVTTLFQEAGSSDDSDNDDSTAKENDPQSSDEETKEEKKKNLSQDSSANFEEEEFNPFDDDFVEESWISRQQTVEEEQESGSSPEKKKKSSNLSQKKEEKKRKKKLKKKAKKKENKEKEKREREKRERDKGRVDYSASEFLAGTKVDDRDQSMKGKGRMASELNMNRAVVMKTELLAAIERLGDSLPPNTLDQLINELGGPEQVAEMTGRKGRVVSGTDGEVVYEARNQMDVPLEILNIAEKERFMSGEKKIAIISEAASSGISLHSDRRAENQSRRVHITLELPWSADKAIQQFGRTHRSNQVSSPEYVFLISELAGEKRFASVVAKRLESLGALTHGDRRATETRDLSQFNLDTKYGRMALEHVLKSVITCKPGIIDPPANFGPGDFIDEMRQYLVGVGILAKANNVVSLEKDAGSLQKFLNRILGLPVHAQNGLFSYFMATLDAIISQAKKDGRYDEGILDLGTGGESVEKKETRVFMGRVEAGSYRTELVRIEVERGMPWPDAFETYTEHKGEQDGFYVSNVMGKEVVMLVVGMGKKKLETGERLYNVYRPNTGLTPRPEVIAEVKKRCKRVSPEDAEVVWKEQFTLSAQQCFHSFVHGRCRNESVGIPCEVGKRSRTWHVLSGSVLSVWPVVENVLAGLSGRRQSKMQIIRVRTTADQRIVGVLIPNLCVTTLISKLEEHTGRSFIEALPLPKQ